MGATLLARYATASTGQRDTSHRRGPLQTGPSPAAPHNTVMRLGYVPNNQLRSNHKADIACRYYPVRHNA